MPAGGRAERNLGRRLAVLGAWLGVLALAAVAPTSAHAQDAINADDEIVYLDPTGEIRIIDYNPEDPVLHVQWVSPIGGWEDFALGDLNGDGDAEIVAIRSEVGGGRLTVYDPVVTQRPLIPGQMFEGVPWDTLYDTMLSGEPYVVTTGDFDPARAGDEILFGRFLPEAERSDPDNYVRVSVLRGVSGTGGRQWETMTVYDSDNEWTRATSGNADDTGPDEVALVDEGGGILSLFRVGSTLDRFFLNRSGSEPWQDAALGQFNAGGPEELAAVRRAYPLEAFWVFRYENNGMVDDRWERFLPSPHVVFGADLGLAAGDVVVMLRTMRAEAGPRPRLIIRYRGSVAPVLLEAQLDGDSGYQSGAGGDVDGDGIDEIVIMRDNRIRVYYAPESSVEREDIVTPTNRFDIHLGNVDANGLGLQAEWREHLVFLPMVYTAP